MTLYGLGVPHDVIVDDYVPVFNHDNTNTIYGNLSPDNSMWGAIYEKAMAKYFGNYRHIVSGDPRWAAHKLTGGPFEMIEHTASDSTADKIWAALEKHTGRDDII